MKNTKLPARARQAGLTLLEVLLSLTIVSAITVGLYQLSERYAEDTRNTIAAQQLRTFGEATRSYIRDNYAAVQAVATPTAPAIIDLGTLVAAGKLSAGHVNVNAYGQSTCALVLEPTADRLQAMVLTEGGETIGDVTLGSIASTVGGSGGAVYSTDATTIRGSVGGWAITAATYDNLTNNLGRRCDGSSGAVRVTAGHPVMALWFENGDTSSAFVARDAVPGRPELNAMNTPLVMNSVQTVDGACTDAGAIARDAAGALLTCQGGQWKSPGDGKCVLTTADMNTLQEDGRCYNGQALPNSPAGGDWIFIEVFRHYDHSTYFLVQRAIGMTGTSRGKTWTRSQNSTTAVGGWGSWQQQTDPGVSVANGGVTATGTLQGSYLYSTGSVRALGDIQSHGNAINYGGHTYNISNTWGFLAYAGGTGGAVANSEPTSPRGSLYVNDIYIRARGRWASQGSAGGSCYWTGQYNLWAGGTGYCADGYYIRGLHGPYYHADTNVSQFLCCQL